MTGPEAGAPVQKLPPGEPGVLFLDTSVIFCSVYRVFERAPRPRRTLPPTLGGVPFSDYRPRGARRRPPGPDGLRTADTQRPGRLRSIWPARPPGHPRTGAFQKIPPGTSSGQPPTGFSQNIRPHPPGRYLLAEVRVPQTAALTRSIEIPLTSGRGTRSETPPRRIPASSFCTPASSFVAPIVYSKRLHGYNAPCRDALTNTEF